MIIGVSGDGWSGSSAVVDLLKEYSDLQVSDDREFQWLHQPDGVFDLEYQLVWNKGRQNTNASIQRFLRNANGRPAFSLYYRSKGKFPKLCEQYIENMTTLTWNGYCTYEPYDIYPRHGKMFITWIDKIINEIGIKIHPAFQWPFPRKTYLAMLTKEEFNHYTRQYLYEVFNALGFDTTKNIVVDQLFQFTHPARGIDYFDSAKSIIVVRDPRDQFINSKIDKVLLHFMPNDTVENFVKYYKSVHTELNSCNENQNVLVVQFEDLIYKTNDTIQVIERFLGIASNSHKYTHKFFKSEISISNTQLFDKYKNRFSREIDYICRECKEWLYDYESIDK